MTNKLPKYFVLQKAGSESSLDFERTVENKEIQRKNNPKGIFLWGVGNSTKKETIEKLLENEPEPYVIFSTITSKFRKQDIEHIDSERKTLRIWNSPELPEGAQVVTYAEKGEKGRTSHYALVCQSDDPLSIIDEDSVRFSKTELTNIYSGKK